MRSRNRACRLRSPGGLSEPQRQDLCERALKFSAAVLRFCEPLGRAGGPFAHMSEQLFEAASSIGANLEEGQAAGSRRDMAAKYSISLRESRESRYWLRLVATNPQFSADAEPLILEATAFVKMLTVSVRRLRQPPVT